MPLLASDLAELGVLVHRFNFSTSGMTNDLSTFARPDLFALDTWTRQVDDVRAVLDAIRDHRLLGSGLPTPLIGHSRGGATAILCAGRHQDAIGIDRIVTINAVDRCTGYTEEEQCSIIERGSIMTKSARTDQDLRIDAGWIKEQRDDPDAHDVIALARTIRIPMLILHGEDDEAVPALAGRNIANAAQKSFIEIPGSNHVLNTRNPADPAEERTEQFKFVLANIGSFLLGAP